MRLHNLVKECSCLYPPSRKALFLCPFQGGDAECPKISA
nr:MAG TPA: Tubulin alpha-1B chain, Tubulin beta-2B, cytoskeleton, division, CELL CYCLE [Caudoviricetes sp.]DAZ60405.1 MAG TPA: Tubulin alpha-1B chain, Tubulin beta-2B, cytoskeleton, division, CELL CYCLE [Caudoviricetes sp.]